MENQRLARFLLTFFLGWIGSIVINHTSLKPEGYTSRTLAYVFLTLVTFGIYQLVASICNLTFDPSKPRNIGYSKDCPDPAYPHTETGTTPVKTNESQKNRPNPQTAFGRFPFFIVRDYHYQMQVPSFHPNQKLPPKTPATT